MRGDTTRCGSRFGAVLSVVALMLLPSCGGSDSDDGTGNGAAMAAGPTCAIDEVAITGTLDGEPVSVLGALGNYAWIQASASKTFDASFDPDGNLHAEWTELVADGHTTVISGSVTLPTGAPHGGSALSGTGTLTKLDDEVKFELTGLGESVQCVTEPCPATDIDGTLQGCVRKEPFMFSQ